MFNAAVAQPTTEFQERRASVRHAVHIKAILRADGKAQPTIIDDLSTGGAGLNGAIGIFANQHVEIELPDGRHLPGKVAWWLSGCCGIQFREPLKPDDPLFAAAK